MKVIERKINELIPAEYNPRQLSTEQAEQLKASLQRFGAVDPAIVNTHPDRKNIIVGGHQRLKTAQSLGWETFPCVEVELDRDKERELNIRLNKNTGGWDFDALANYFEVEELTEWGFKDEELFGDIETEELEAEEDNYEEPDEIHTDIVLGDLIEIGEHRLLCGDSTDSDQVAKLMDGQKADMVFTDPPYGLGGYGGRKNMDLKNDDADDNTIVEFYNLPIYFETDEVYIWGNAINLFKHVKQEPRDVIVWRKNNFGLGRGYRGQYELCFYYGSFSGSDSDVWDVKKDTKYEHPTQKPVELISRAIKNSKPKLIVDLFLGSGSTIVGCHQLKRKCYGMELDPKYCQVIIDRMLKLDDTLQVKINGEPYGV